MKTLFFVRHGKSSWESNVSDKDRSLKERGVLDGILMSQWFKKQNENLEAIFSSPANRALHTASIFTREIGFASEKLVISEELYDFSGESAHQFIKSLDNDLGSVMIFGHNYAFTHLINTLGSIYEENLPTTGLVKIEFNTMSWAEISQGTTKYTKYPKALRV